MKTKSTYFTSRLIRVLLSSTLLISLITQSIIAVQAAIIFQDDDFHDIPSEGLIINSDDGGDEDVTFRLGNDGTDANFIFNDGTGDLSITTSGGDISFGNENLSTTGGLNVDGNVDFTNASEFHIREVADEASATCTTIDELVLDTTENLIYACTGVGAPGTWSSTTGLQDFESVYSTDSDNTLTASSTFDIAATGAIGIDSAAGLTLGGSSVGLTADGGILSLTGDGTNDIDILNVGASLDFDSSSFLVDTTGTLSLDADISSNLTVGANAAGNQTLTLSAANAGTGTADVDITADDEVAVTTTNGDFVVSAGDDIIFDDVQLTGIVQVSDTATDWNATFAKDGIVDNINSFASTATGEGASNVGIEDSGGNFTGTTVESALTELSASVSGNFEVMTFEPEYPNVAVFKDGSSNKGKLEADFDSTNREQYYRWTTRKTVSNDIDLRARFELPSDFSATGDMTVRIYSDTNVLGDNSVAVTVRNDTDNTTCHADPAQAASVATTWETITITAAEINTGCTGASALNAGDILEIQIKLAADNTSGGGIQVGTIDYTYTK